MLCALTYIPPHCLLLLSRPNQSVAAATKGMKSNSMAEEDQAEGEEESATPVFNVDRLKAETKTPFRTVCNVVSVIVHCKFAGYLLT